MEHIKTQSVINNHLFCCVCFLMYIPEQQNMDKKREHQILDDLTECLSWNKPSGSLT